MNENIKVTLRDIEANIASEHYFTAEDGVGRWSRGQTSNCGKNPVALSLLTFCVLVLKNGFTVTGESACVSPENFYAELGHKIARQKAVEKVWPLLAYELRSKLKSADQLSQSGENKLPKHILDTLRFYAYGEHFHIDPKGEGFKTVRCVPENWMCSQRENDTTMIENGGLARAALRGEFFADIPEFHPIEGEKYEQSN